MIVNVKSRMRCRLCGNPIEAGRELYGAGPSVVHADCADRCETAALRDYVERRGRELRERTMLRICRPETTRFQGVIP